MKDVIKENFAKNKKRIIVWGSIALFSIVFSVLGSISFNNGHGTVGSIRVKIIPITNTFNELDAVIRNGKIKAKVSGRDIVVTYEGANSKTEKYVYSFDSKDGVDYITNTYPDSNKTNGEFIATNMIEAIYKINGGKGKVSDKYRLTSFSATSVKDGASYSSKNELTTVDINIRTNIVNNAIALKVQTIQESDYIHVEELAEMLPNLKKIKTYRLKKDNTTIYVKESAIYYEVYFSFKDKEIMERTAASIIYILKPELYNKLIDESTGMLNFNISSGDYKITENVSFQEERVFDSLENITELLIFK